MAYQRGETPPRTRSLAGPIVGALAVVALLWAAGLAGRDAELPTPTPVPTASGPLTIAFSTALDQVSGEAGSPVDRFRAGDGFAYSVRLPSPSAHEVVMVEIERIGGGATEIVQPWATQGIVPTSPIIAFSIRASSLLETWGPGDYVMRMSWSGGGPLIASGEFTLVETPIQP